MEMNVDASIQFDEERERRLKQTLERYPTREAVLLPALWLAQEQFGTLTDEVLDYVASRLDLSPVKVKAVCEFYTMYKRRPVGTFHLQLCRNLTCSVLGAENLQALIEEQAGVKPGETSADGVFSLELVECLGSCGTAPVLRVNDTYFESVTMEQVRTILDGCRKGTLPAPEELGDR